MWNISYKNGLVDTVWKRKKFEAPLPELLRKCADMLDAFEQDGFDFESAFVQPMIEIRADEGQVSALTLTEGSAGIQATCGLGHGFRASSECVCALEIYALREKETA
jgi:hypothetical protein